jgi:hypothetical protein
VCHRLAVFRRIVVRARSIRVAAFGIWFVVLGGFLLFNPRRQGGTTGVILRWSLALLRFCVFWGLVWFAIWRLDATLLVGSRSGLQTVLQVLPATTVALLVLILGSVFVVAQITVQLWGTRAPVMVGLDDLVQTLVAHPLIIVSVALLIAGQVPDVGNPSDAANAGAAVLVLATISVFSKAAFALPVLAQRYTLPRGFPQYVIKDLDREFASGQLGLVVMRVPLLTEMLRLAIGRGDSVAVAQILEALTEFHQMYLAAVASNPELRNYGPAGPDDPAPREGWFAMDLVAGLVAAAEDGLRRGTPARDLNAIAGLAGGLVARSIQARQTDDAQLGIDALTHMGTLTQQVAGFINHFSEPAWQLAFGEHTAEETKESELAASALASWALIVSYAAWHLRLDRPHPLVARSLKTLGPDPEWDAVPQILTSDLWMQKWANKMYMGAEIVILFLSVLRSGFAVRGNDAEFSAWFNDFAQFVWTTVHGPPDESAA